MAATAIAALGGHAGSGTERASAGEIRVLRVADGDTLTIERAGERRRVRLAHIDAPESTQAHGRAATDALRLHVSRGAMSLRELGEDRYGRLLAEIWVNGRNVNQALVEDGHAWVYRGRGRPDSSYLAAEVEARKRRVGLWGDPSPTPPGEYRKARR